MIKLKDILNEESIKPGSKEYFNKNLPDEYLIKLANTLSSYPHTRVKGAPNLQLYFRDIAHILGLEINPAELLTYTDGKGYLDKKKMKFNPKKSPLFQLYKVGELTKDEYVAVQTPLLKKYSQVAKLFMAGVLQARF